jgi:hypothetical protein
MVLSLSIVALLLVVAVGVIQAQRPQPAPEDQPLEEIDAVNSVIPIQGRLTDASGKPLNGNQTVTARLYEASAGGTALCADTDGVAVDNGLFNMDLNGCWSADIDGKQLYLGITVGSDPEMTPRQPIYPVPYAWSLRPGAIISSTTSGAILHIENWNTSGRGLRAYAKATSGENFGVVGASESPEGYGGYFYNTTTGDGVYGRGWFGVYGTGTNSGVYGRSENSQGVYGYSPNGYGMAATTGADDYNYGLYTPDNIHARDIHLTSAQMQVVRNAGQASLEPGDVVVFAGVEAGDPPLIEVVQATDAHSTAVAGVVHSRYNPAAAAVDPEQGARADLEVTPAGPAAPGEMLLIVVQGPAQVKASAVAGAIQPGDLLSTAGPAGRAAKAGQVSLEGVETARPGTVLGKALEPLETGDQRIYVFVTLQ